jgi:hypothetical protein
MKDAQKKKKTSSILYIIRKLMIYYITNYCFFRCCDSLYGKSAKFYPVKNQLFRAVCWCGIPNYLLWNNMHDDLGITQENR